MAALNFVAILAAMRTEPGTIRSARRLNRHIDEQHITHHRCEIEDTLIGNDRLWVVGFIRWVGEELIDLGREVLAEIAQAAHAFGCDMAFEFRLHHDALRGTGKTCVPAEIDYVEVIPKLKGIFLKIEVAAVPDVLV